MMIPFAAPRPVHAVRLLAVSLLSAVLLLVLTTLHPLAATAAPNPNEHAKPEVIDFDEIEEDFSAFFTEVCGFPVTVDAEGWVKFIEINASEQGKRQPLSLAIYHISSETFTSEWSTLTVEQDIGPDITFVEDGQLKAAATGRSLTGSGVIGRVVFDVETGEILSEAGKRVYDDFVATVCSRLAPDEG